MIKQMFQRQADYRLLCLARIGYAQQVLEFASQLPFSNWQLWAYCMEANLGGERKVYVQRV